MKKGRTITWILLIAAIVVIGILIYFFSDRTPEMQIGEEGTITGTHSIAEVMALDQPYECTFSRTDGSAQMSGVLRTADGNLRGDFDIDSPQGSLASHFIATGTDSYIWTSLGQVGFKVPTVEYIENASNAQQLQIIGTRDEADYVCNPWNANLTLFNLPSGIEFTEPGEEEGE